MDTFTEIIKDIHLPVAEALWASIDHLTNTEDVTITTDLACKYAQVVSLLIKKKVTLTPSVNDIEEYIEGLTMKWAGIGMTGADLALVEAYVLASFGFTGDELDDF